MVNEKKRFVISDGGISYYVTYDEGDNAGYGIYAELDDEKSDSMCVRKIYFTEEEAVLRCKWLCENQVFPISLRDVLVNII